MRGTAAVILGLLLVSLGAGARDASYGLDAYVRVGQEPVDIIRLTVPPGSVAGVDLASDLRLEFAAPDRGARERRTVTRLLRRSGSGFEVLHTARQGSGVGDPRRNGYVVCGEQVRFLSPAPGQLPECN